MRAGALLGLALILTATQTSWGQSDASTTVSVTFDLYGNSVEPFDDTKTKAIQMAVAQSAGHGVTADNVQISVVKTYADQQNSGRRLLQDSNLVQPGVRLTAAIQTTQQSAPDVASAVDSALGNNQIAQVFNQNGGQADYTKVVTASSTGGSSSSSPSDSGSSPSGGSSSGSTDSGSSSGSGKKSSFPSWAVAIIVIVLILLIAAIAGFFIWRKCAARRAIRAQEFEAASYFSNNKSAGAKVAGAFSGLSAGASGLLGRFKKAPPPVVSSTPSTDGTSGLMRNPATPFSQIGFSSPGATGNAPSPGIVRSPSASQDRYGGFVARPTTPKGSSLPTANPLYHGPPKPANAYTPRRAGRLESLRDIDDL